MARPGLYAAEGYRLNGAANPRGPTQFTDYGDDDESLYYGTDEAANSLAAYSEGGTAYSGTDVSSSYASSFSSYASGVSARPTETDIANMPANNRDDMLAARPTQQAVTEKRRDSLNLLGIFASISEVFATKDTGDELSEEDRQALLKHWDNYDIHRTLKPNLLPRDEAHAGEIILAAFRINQARKKCYRIKQDKMQRETNKAAVYIQCAARRKQAQQARGKKLAEKKRELTELEEYNDFKKELKENGLSVIKYEHKAKKKLEKILNLDKDEYKYLTWKAGSAYIPATGKFDLMFLFKVHRDCVTPKFREFPRALRGPKDNCFSLEGKDVLDFEVKDMATRDRYVRCFNRLIKEMNSPEAIYRDAYGNRRRVIKSVFEHEQEVVHMKTSKDNPVDLKGKNKAQLWFIKHNFTKQRNRMENNRKKREEKEKKRADARAAEEAMASKKAARDVDEYSELSAGSLLSRISFKTDEKYEIMRKKEDAADGMAGLDPDAEAARFKARLAGKKTSLYDDEEESIDYSDSDEEEESEEEEEEEEESADEEESAEEEEGFETEDEEEGEEDFE